MVAGKDAANPQGGMMAACDGADGVSWVGGGALLAWYGSGEEDVDDF